MLKVGLVGFGMAAQVMHAPFLKVLPPYEVVAVLERNREDSKKLFPDATIVRSIEDLLQSDIDLVVITTPNETHLPYALQALAAGKHVVLEKPFTITSEDAEQLIQAGKAAGKILSVFQNRRYTADFLTIQKVIEEGMLGSVHEYEAHYDRYRPDPKPGAWREADSPGSGILYDLGPHLIDQALCLFGLPQHITADIRRQRPHAVTDDYFDLRLDYGFTKVILKAGMLVREPGPRYSIHGTLGSFIKSGEDPQEAILKTGQLPTAPDWGCEPAELYGLLHTTVNGKEIREIYPSLQGGFGKYYQHLYDTIVNGAPLSERPEHGYNTIRLIELAKESQEAKATIPCTQLMAH
ncbi:Gfo/Idh/MocA family oxidoreductase [Filimonas effusa]|uniref:Oxidoreductase n=1 Tax=Filimonas effusa TaxID=2508721 RepID=A0A4Q1D8D7_9BACT|nr:Gfo/Idh/MocA family oxidoreductase [Filimonas effusa]RXK85594.1 oxidoreductase [Filimonas effusa]